MKDEQIKSKICGTKIVKIREIHKIEKIYKAKLIL